MSLLQKRKYSEMTKKTQNNDSSSPSCSEGILCCLQMVSIINISFGHPIYEKYFEGVKNVIGEKRAHQIFNKLKKRNDNQINSIGYNQKQESKEINKNILQQMNTILGDKLNREIQKKVKLFQTCIDCCIQLQLIPQAAKELINIINGREENFSTNDYIIIEQIKKARQLIQFIKKFIGEDQLIQTILHSLKKNNINNNVYLSNSKFNEEDTCEELSTSNSLSDDNTNRTISSKFCHNNNESIHKLPQSFKQTVLGMILLSLSKFQESIYHIKTFTSTIA